MKQLLFALFAAVITAVFAFSLWWPEHYVMVGWPPFIGALGVLASLVLVGMFVWGMRRLGKVAVRWGFGGYSPVFLFVMGSFVLMIYPVFLGNSTIDIMIHDTYFVIANVHATRGVGILFGLAAVVYFFYPRIVRRPLQRELGYLHFWLTSVGFLLFFGTVGYSVGSGRYIEVRSDSDLWEWTDCSTVTLLVLGVGQLVFLFNLVYSGVRAKRVK